MKSRQTKWIIIFFALFVISWTYKDKNMKGPINKKINKKESFQSYLNTRLHTNIKKDSTYYVLISQFGCSSCIKTCIEHFKPIKKATFIMNPVVWERYFANNHEGIVATTLIDSTDKINRLSYHHGNIGIVSTSKANIDTVVYVEPTTVNEQIALLK